MGEQRRDGTKYWRTKDGRSLLTKDMGDRHLDNSIALLIRGMGPSHMLYMMGKMLVADPYELSYDDNDVSWCYLLTLERERARRLDAGIKVPDLD